MMGRGGGVGKPTLMVFWEAKELLHEKDYEDQEILTELIVGPRNSAICDFGGP